MFYGLSVETLNVHGMAIYNHQVLYTDSVMPTHFDQGKVVYYFVALKEINAVNLAQLISNYVYVGSAFHMLQVLYYDVVLSC